MKLGDFFINIATKGDTKELDKAIAKMEKAQAQEKSKAQFKEKILRINKLIAKATKSEQIERLKGIKAQIRDNYVNKIKLDRLKDQSKALKEQNARWAGMVKGVAGFVAGITTAIVAMDRLGNSVLKTNQLYTNFSRQTGISIGNLNKMAGLAKLSGMNLPVEQVAGDLNSLQQKIFRLSRFGQGSEIFAQLGMNPIGMKSDQFLTALRQRFKSMSAEEKSYALDELGLSREWLNVLDLSDEKYADLIKKSSKLQLSEKERKQLAEYTLIQQQNNMRWELAKQRLIIAILPLITKIMEVTSQIAENITKSLGNDKVVAVVRDIAIWMGIAALRAKTIQQALAFLFGGGLLKGLGGGLLGMLGLGAGKPFLKGAAGKAAAGLGAKTIGKRALGLAGPVGWWLMLAWTAWDIFGLLKQWFDKDTEDEDEEPPIDPTASMAYQTVSSNMVNHFYNNPAPQNQIAADLDLYVTKYLAGAKK